MVGLAGSSGAKASTWRVRLLNRRRDIGTQRAKAGDSRTYAGQRIPLPGALTPRRESDRALHRRPEARPADDGRRMVLGRKGSARVRHGSPTLAPMFPPATFAASCRCLPAALALCLALPAAAQQPSVPAQASQPENVRIDYAQVLRAEPVYQTLRATSLVERCEASTPVDDTDGKTGFARVIGAVKGALTPDPKIEEVAPSAGGECRMVPVDREFRRPVGYDVDYVHKGVKYRSRLPV